MINKKTYNMVLTSIFGAIIFILGIIPNVGYIRILPGVAVTIIHIPVIIAIFVLPLSYVTGLGFIFGLSSLIVAATQAQTPFDQSFVYPWISILPRMLFAISGVYIFELFNKIKKFNKAKHIIFIIVSIVTSFALFFGLKEVVKNINYNQSTNLYNELIIYENDDNYNEDKYNELLNNYEIRYEFENNRYQKVKLISNVVIYILIISTVVLYAYLVYFSKYKDKYFYIPSIFILSTFLHTIYVIGAVVLFQPNIFYEGLGNNISLINIVLSFALTNGLVEAIFGAIVGSPIVVAIESRMERDNDFIS